MWIYLTRVRNFPLLFRDTLFRISAPRSLPLLVRSSPQFDLNASTDEASNTWIEAARAWVSQQRLQRRKCTQRQLRKPPWTIVDDRLTSVALIARRAPAKSGVWRQTRRHRFERARCTWSGATAEWTGYRSHERVACPSRVNINSETSASQPSLPSYRWSLTTRFYRATFIEITLTRLIVATSRDRFNQARFCFPFSHPREVEHALLSSANTYG